MNTIKVNVAYANINQRKDSLSRSEHVFERMRLRGIDVNNIKDAVRMGAKNVRKDGSIVSYFRWFKIIYREYKIEGMQKIYPITVIEL